MSYDIGYATIGHCVYLSHAPKQVRRRAKKAGLTILNAKDFRKEVFLQSALDRMIWQATWYDTVRYP